MPVQMQRGMLLPRLQHEWTGPTMKKKQTTPLLDPTSIKKSSAAVTIVSSCLDIAARNVTSLWNVFAKPRVVTSLTRRSFSACLDTEHVTHQKTLRLAFGICRLQMKSMLGKETRTMNRRNTGSINSKID